MKTVDILLAVGLVVLASMWGQTVSAGAAPGRGFWLHVTLWGGMLLWIRQGIDHPGLLLGTAVLTRLVMLPMEPSDDVNRYLWEGRVQLADENPYHLAPIAEALTHLRDENWPRINHKDMSAAYPPGAELILRGLAWVCPELWFFKFAMTLFDIGVILVLYALLQSGGQKRKKEARLFIDGRDDPSQKKDRLIPRLNKNGDRQFFARKTRWLALYALNPVILLSFAGEGHLDVIMLLFTALALLCWRREKPACMFASLALAVQVKYTAGILLPFLLLRNTWKWAWVFIVVLLLPVLPFGFGPELFNSLRQFSAELHYNGSVHKVFWLLSGKNELFASSACLILFLLGGGVIRLFNAHPLEGGLAVTAWFLLCAPTVHFWYLTWLIPFLVFIPSRPGIILRASIAFTFVNLGAYHETGIWREIPWVPVLVYSSLLLAFTSPCLRHCIWDRTPVRRSKSISVIVPTCNEESFLSELIESLAQSRVAPDQVLIADGRSTDQTNELARALGCEVIETKTRGRGAQMAAALPQATGDVLVFAHADMRFEPDTIPRILTALHSSGIGFGAVGNRFAMCQGEKAVNLAFIQRLNHLRARFGGISFGDQCQFATRDHIDRVGFPDLQLMEDVENSLRAREIEHPLYLGGGIISSPREWNRPAAQRRRRALNIVHLVASYLWSRWWRNRVPKVESMYRNYYKR